MEEEKWESTPSTIPEVVVVLRPTETGELLEEEEEEEEQKSDAEMPDGDTGCSEELITSQMEKRDDVGDDSNTSESSLANRVETSSQSAVGNDVSNMLTHNLIVSTFQQLTPSSSFLPSFYHGDDDLSIVKNLGCKRGPGRPRKKEGTIPVQRKKLFPGRPRVQTRRASHKAIIPHLEGSSPPVEGSVERFSDYTISRIRQPIPKSTSFLSSPSKLQAVLPSTVIDTEDNFDPKGTTKFQPLSVNVVQERVLYDEAYQESVLKKTCSFCNLSDDSLLGQGDLVKYEPSANFNVFKKGTKSRRSSSESDSSLVVETLPKLSPPRRAKGVKGRRSTLPDSEPLILGPADELTIVGFPEEPDVASLFESSGHTYAHHCCAAWSEGVCQTADFVLINVDKAVFSSMNQTCSSCRRFGAAIRCRDIKCNRVYHYPCAVSSGTFQDIKTLTLLCPFHLNQAPLLSGAEANCIVCDVPGNISALLFCTSCGHHYHGECLDPLVAVNPVVRAGWQCPECKICQTCRQPGDDNKMLVCDTCDKGFHTFCLKPMMATIPKNGWKCKSCRVCGDCGSRTPGSGPSSRWHMNYTVCDSCYQQRNKGVACPLCRKAYRQFCQRAEMSQCSVCKKYIHMECDPRIEKHRDSSGNGAYTCPVCVNAQLQGLSNMPVVETTGKVKEDSQSLGFESSLTSPDGFRSPIPDESSMDHQTMKVPMQGFVSDISDDMHTMDIVPLISESPLHRPVSGGKFAAKKRMNFNRLRGSSGKFAGRKRAKTAEFRRKRGPKPKVRPFLFSTSPLYQLQSLLEFRDAKQDDEPTVDNKIVLCSTNDEYVLSQDLCVMCGSFGKDEEGRLIACSQCGQCYHPYCVNVKLTKVVLKKGWRCLDCTVCEGCGQPHDEGRLLLCDDCDISYHTYCSDPPLEEVPQGNWKCKWCVVCYQCGATTPGTGCSWQNNYTFCGPCSSQSVCPVCHFRYQENDLVLQCTVCDRWLHGKCDQVLLEEEAERAADFGYHCIFCRPKDELPPHLIPRVPSRSPSPIEHDPIYRPPKETNSFLTLGNRYEFDDSMHQLDDSETSTTGVYDLIPDVSSKVKSQAQFYMDGVFLSESGMTLIKSMTIEQPKKQRMRRQKNPSGAQLSPVDVANELEMKMEQGDDETKSILAEDIAKIEAASNEKKRRQRKLHKLGIGGFLVKARGRILSLKDGLDNPDVQELGDVSVTLDGCEVVQDKPKRKRRPKKKNPLEDCYPGYIQEAFFGKELLTTAKETPGTDLQSVDDGDSSSSFLMSQAGEKQDLMTAQSSAVGQSSGASASKSLYSPVHSLPSKPSGPVTGQQDDDSKKMSSTKPVVDDEDLGDTEALKDLLPLPQDDELMDMLMNGDDELTKQDDGLPQMDSKDVEDIFKGVLSPSTVADQQHGVGSASPPPQTSTSRSSPSLPSQSSQPQAPVTPTSLQSIGSPFSMPPPSPYPSEYGSSQFSPQVMDVNPWSEIDSESQTHGQKSTQKWESDETLGVLATTSPVLYANINHPNLKQEFPLWSDRVKQIAKIWRGLPSDKRQPYLQKARENRTANRMQKSQSVSRSDSDRQNPPLERLVLKEPVKGLSRDQRTQRELEQERHWKQLQVIRQQQQQQQQQVLQEQRMQATTMSSPVHNSPSSSFQPELPPSTSDSGLQATVPAAPSTHPSQTSFSGALPQQPSNSGRSPNSVGPLIQVSRVRPPIDPSRLPPNEQQNQSPGTPRPGSASGDPFASVYRHPGMGGRPVLNLPQKQQLLLRRPEGPRLLSSTPSPDYYQTPPATPAPPNVDPMQHQSPPLHQKVHDPYSQPPSTPRPVSTSYSPPPPSPQIPNSPTVPLSPMDPYAHQPATPHPSVGIRDSYIQPPNSVPSRIVDTPHQLQHLSQGQPSPDQFQQQQQFNPPTSSIGHISSPTHNVGVLAKPNQPTQMVVRQHTEVDAQQVMKIAMQQGLTLDSEGAQQIIARQQLRDLLQRQQQKKQEHGQIPLRHWPPGAVGAESRIPGGNDIFRPPLPPGMRPRVIPAGMLGGDQPFRHPSQLLDQRILLQRASQDPRLRAALIQQQQQLRGQMWAQMRVQGPRMVTGFLVKPEVTGEPHQQMLEGPQQKTQSQTNVYDIGEKFGQPKVCLPINQQQPGCLPGATFPTSYTGQPHFSAPKNLCLPFTTGNHQEENIARVNPPQSPITSAASPGIPSSPQVFQQQQQQQQQHHHHHVATMVQQTPNERENELMFHDDGTRIIPKIEKSDLVEQGSCAVLSKSPVSATEDNNQMEKKKQTAGDLVKEVEEQASQQTVVSGVDVEEDLDDDDELLGLGNDFNILEYADPELDSGLVGDGEKNNILDEHLDLDEKDDELGTGDVIDLKSNIDQNLKKDITGEELKKTENSRPLPAPPPPLPSSQVSSQTQAVKSLTSPVQDVKLKLSSVDGEKATGSCKLEQLDIKLQEEKKFTPEFQVKCGKPFQLSPTSGPFPMVSRQPEMSQQSLPHSHHQRPIGPHMNPGHPSVQSAHIPPVTDGQFLKHLPPRAPSYPPPPPYQPSPNMAHFQALVGQPRLPHPPPPPQIIPNPRLQSMSSNVMVQRPPTLHHSALHEERLTHQDQPLLLEDLVEQEKQEQKRQSQENLMSPPADALLSDIDFERLKADVLSGPPDDTIGGPSTIVPSRPPSSESLLQVGLTSSPHLQQFLQSHSLAQRSEHGPPSWPHMVQSTGTLRAPFPSGQLRGPGQVMGSPMRMTPSGLVSGDGAMRMDMPVGGPHGPVRNTFPISLPPPPLPPSDPTTEQDRQQHAQYEQWLVHQQALLSNQQKYLETEVGKLRKTKKSLNARQRQLRRNGQELTDHDAAELARITQEQAGLQKQLDQVRKQGRQHTMLFQEYRVKQQKWQQQVIPQSSHPQVVSMQLSPLGASSSPHRQGSITPQSPLMSPSPLAPSTSPRMQHSPSPLMQHSPIGETRSPLLQSTSTGIPQSPVGIQPSMMQQSSMMQHSPGPIPHSPLMQQSPVMPIMQQTQSPMLHQGNQASIVQQASAPVVQSPLMAQTQNMQQNVATPSQAMQHQQSPILRSPMLSQTTNSQSVMPCSPVTGMPPSPMMQQQLMMPKSPAPLMLQTQQPMIVQSSAAIRSPMMPHSPMMQQSHGLPNQQILASQASAPIRSPMMQQSHVLPNQQQMVPQSPAPIQSPMAQQLHNPASQHQTIPLSPAPIQSPLMPRSPMMQQSQGPPNQQQMVSQSPAPIRSPMMPQSPIMQHSHIPVSQQSIVPQSPAPIRSPMTMMPQSPIMQQSHITSNQQQAMVAQPPNSIQSPIMNQSPMIQQQSHITSNQPQSIRSPMMPQSPVMQQTHLSSNQQPTVPQSPTPIRSPMMPQSPMMQQQSAQQMVPQSPTPIRSPMMPQSPMMQQQPNTSNQQTLVSQSPAPIRSPMMQQQQTPPNQPMMAQSPSPIRSPMMSQSPLMSMIQQSQNSMQQSPIGTSHSSMMQQQIVGNISRAPMMPQSPAAIRRLPVAPQGQRPPLSVMQHNVRMLPGGMMQQRMHPAMMQGNVSQESVVYRNYPLSVLPSRVMQTQQDGARPQLMQEDSNLLSERYHQREEQLQQRSVTPQGRNLQEARDSLSRILQSDLVGQPFPASLPLNIISTAPGIVVQSRPMYTIRDSPLSRENLIALARQHSLEGRDIRLPILDANSNQPIRTPLNILLERMSTSSLERSLPLRQNLSQLDTANILQVKTSPQIYEAPQAKVKDTDSTVVCNVKSTLVDQLSQNTVDPVTTTASFISISTSSSTKEIEQIKTEKVNAGDTNVNVNSKCPGNGHCSEEPSSTQQNRAEHSVVQQGDCEGFVQNPPESSSSTPATLSTAVELTNAGQSSVTDSGICQSGHGCPDIASTSSSQSVLPKDEQSESENCASTMQVKSEERFSCDVAANSWTKTECKEEISVNSCREQPLIPVVTSVEENQSSQIQSVTHTLSFTLRQTGMPSTPVSPQQSTTETKEDNSRHVVTTTSIAATNVTSSRPTDTIVQTAFPKTQPFVEHSSTSVVISKDPQSSTIAGSFPMGMQAAGQTPFHVSATLKSLAIKAEKKDLSEIEVKRELGKLSSCRFSQSQSTQSESSSPENSPLTMGPGVANHTYAVKTVDSAGKVADIQLHKKPNDLQLDGDHSNNDGLAGAETGNQNVLLKQLLQNCPSAENQTKDDDFSEIGKEKDASVILEKASEDAKSKFAYVEKRDQQSIKGTSQPPVDILQSAKSGPRELEIRRAQLEREPTPPPPSDDKPKRKRPKKRKDPKEGSPTKKRNKKGVFGKEDSLESFIETLILQLRSLPPIRITEPSIQPNFNVSPAAGSGDMNLRESQLRGSFGNATLPNQSDCYSTYPFGSNPPTPPSSLPPTPQPIRGFYNQEFATKTKDSQGRVDIPPSIPTPPPYLDVVRPFRDADSPDTIISSSSPECLLSDPTYKFLGLRLIEDNTPAWNGRKSCSPVVPIVAPIPIHALTRLPLKLNTLDEDDEEKDKENKNEIVMMKTKMIGMGTPSIPLKDSANVSVTLTLTSAAAEDIRGVLASLADILNIPPPTAYEIVERTATPPSQKLGLYKKAKDQAVNIHTLLNGKPRFCRHCDIVVLSAGILKKVAELPYLSKEDMEEDEVIFCSTNCYMQFALMHRALASTEEKEAAAVVSHTTSEPPPETSPEPKDDAELEAIEAEKSSTKEDEEKRSTPSLPPTPKEPEEAVSVDTIKKEGKAKRVAKKISTDAKHAMKRKKDQRWCYWAFEDFSPKQRSVTDNGVNELLDSMCMFVAPEKLPVDGRKCVLCHEMGDGESSGPARLLNMDVNKWVHLNCALWSAEVYETVNGALINVDVACKRALILSCSKCHRMGASLKCFKTRCSNIYHFPCAVKDRCVFFKDKTVLCAYHSSKLGNLENELESLAVLRRVYVNRDEHKQIASMIHQGEQNLLRVGSLIFLNIGQLLPQQLQAFHTCNSIYPVGYKIVRMYWSMNQIAKRCQYICTILEKEGKPLFQIQIRDRGYSEVVLTDTTPKAAWMKILEPIEKMRKETKSIKVFPNFISGEDLLGLTEPAVLRILESLPGVETLSDYNFKYGKSPLLELPLAINPTGCARSEPKLRTHFKRSHTLHTSNTTRFFLASALAGLEASSPYTKQFVHSKSSQYRKMKTEWRNNVYLARSQIQGLGLYAARDIERHTMVIEYIGQLIRNEIAERNEAIYEAQNRGVYMFRLDENRVIDATLCGGLARYMNHSCNPNCVAEVVQIDRDNKILIIANRRISRGEELTYDYKFEVEDDQHKIPCLCGAFCCRKWMN